MCIFTSDKDIPGHVRLSTRTLQYLIIPLLSAALLVVGILHVDDCQDHLLPVWHIVAGSSGLIVPLLYLLFDDLNPALAKRCPALSEALDNVVVFVLPVYILFEIGWLITGTVWIFGVNGSDDEECDKKTIYVFSIVVIINFWIHILTPLLFMFCLCCSKICPFLHCTYWGIVTNAIKMWTRTVRIAIVSTAALPLGLSMVAMGAHSLKVCQTVVADTLLESQTKNISGFSPSGTTDPQILSLEMLHIPVWLLVAGVLLLAVPLVYYCYDAFCKPGDVSEGLRKFSQVLVILFLLAGLAWSVVGFVWIFGVHSSDDTSCGSNSATYKFAFASLIILNCLMDVWICFKICVILYWALISGDD